MFFKFEGKIINSNEVEYVDLEYVTDVMPDKAWRRYDKVEHICKLVVHLKSGNKMILKTSSGVNNKKDMEIYKSQFYEMLQCAQSGFDYDEIYDYEEELNEKAKYEYGW